MRVYASLDTLVAQGTYGEIADVLLERYGRLAQGAGLSPRGSRPRRGVRRRRGRLEEGCWRAGCNHAR